MMTISISLDPRKPYSQVLQYNEEEILPIIEFSFDIFRKVRKRKVFKAHFNRNVKLAYEFFELVSKQAKRIPTKIPLIKFEAYEGSEENLMTDINSFLLNHKLSKNDTVS